MQAISRRSCLKSGAALLATAAFGTAWSLPSELPLGVQLYSVGDELKRGCAGDAEADQGDRLCAGGDGGIGRAQRQESSACG